MKPCVGIETYRSHDWAGVAALFDAVFAERFRLLSPAIRAGLVRERLEQRAADARVSAAWVARRAGDIIGFVSAHTLAKDEAVITTPVAKNPEIAGALLDAAEDFLLTQKVHNLRIEGLDRIFQPGFGDPLHMQLIARGYNSYSYRGLEMAFELDLARFCVAPAAQDFRRRNEAEGLVFEFLQERHHASLRALAPADWMLKGLADGSPYAICRHGDEVIGFCGGCHVNREYGLGNWSFIFLKGWTEKLDGKYYHRGIGAVMLAMADEWLKDNGARCQVLFTGVDNPSQRLYLRAGYCPCFVSAHSIRKMLT